MANIPKIIHYVWVGGKPKPEHVLTCIKSWEKYCPDYQIKEWNEHNFDVENHPFVKQAFEQKNWALMSDVIRVWALVNEGGVYFDTDLELVSSIDDLLECDAFLSYESPYWFGSAVLATVKNHPIFTRVLKRYDYVRPIGFHTNPLTVHAFTAVLRYDYGFKPNGKKIMMNDRIFLLSSEYFYPQHYMSGKLKTTEHTKGIHHYYSSWHSTSQSRSQRFASLSYKILGRHIFKIFEWIVARSYYRVLKKEFIKMDQKE